MYVISRDDMNIFNSIKCLDNLIWLISLSLSLSLSLPLSLPPPSLTVRYILIWHRLLEDPTHFFEPHDEGSHIFPSYVAQNIYGKCVAIGHTEFSVMLAYGCSSVYFKWALVGIIMTENTKTDYIYIHLVISSSAPICLNSEHHTPFVLPVIIPHYKYKLWSSFPLVG